MLSHEWMLSLEWMLPHEWMLSQQLMFSVLWMFVSSSSEVFDWYDPEYSSLKENGSESDQDSSMGSLSYLLVFIANLNNLFP